MTPFVLPSGFAIKHAHFGETTFLFREIFENRVYVQGGIVLPPRCVVVDVGANIGLFTLFVLQERPGAHVHAFEPAPATFAILPANTAAYPTVEINNCGLGSECKEAVFTFLPQVTALSGYDYRRVKERFFSAVDSYRKKFNRHGTGKSRISEDLSDFCKLEMIPRPFGH